MTILFSILSLQVIIGSFISLWHHELIEKLPSEINARHELALHAARELIYSIIFFGLAWYEWRGSYSIILSALFFIMLMVSLCDIIIEDKTRKLSTLERILQTILVINIGIFLAVFYPILSNWFSSNSVMKPINYGVWSWILTLYSAGTLIWSLRLIYAAMNLHILKVPEWQRKPFKKGENNNPKTYLITGATGFIGAALVRKLIENGDNIIALGRSLEKIHYKFGSRVEGITELKHFCSNKKIDVIINLAGENLASGLWTKKRKETFLNSRAGTSKSLVEFMNSLKNKPELFVSGSAIGFYGNRQDEELTEKSSPGNDFMANLCLKWEEEALRAEKLGIRVVRLRTGLVLGSGGGILQPLLLATKFCAGAIMGSGKQYMSWIDIDDIIHLILFTVSNNKINGAVNATAPNPATQRDFMKKLGAQLKRPVFLWAPAFMLRLIFRDMADLFLNGQKTLPAKAHEHGFEFLYPELEQSFDKIISKNTKNAADTPGESEIFYNSECPVCDMEINHYCKLSASSEAPMQFKDINSNPDILVQYGLCKEDILRRMYVLKPDGSVANGIDATVHIWSQLPRYKLFSKALQIPPIHFAGSFIYEAIIVPWLAYKNSK